jgi:hypothetical protein
MKQMVKLRDRRMMISKMRKGFACPFPFCDQICSRKWNMKVHLKRKHYGQGQPVDLSKIKEDQYGNNNDLSDLILTLYGPDIGMHARSAIGVQASPVNLPVIIDALVEITA